MLLDFLEHVGLTSKEVLLYELLLRLGDMPVGALIRESRLKRATVYKTLYALEKKKLITKRDIKKKLHVRPEPPDRLAAITEIQFDRLQHAKVDLARLLPQLTSSYVLSVEKPVVTTFEGIAGLKEIYEDTLREGKPIYAVLQTAEVDPELFRYLTHEYARKRVRAEIQAKVIVSSGTWSNQYHKKDKKELRESRLVPNTQFPFQHEVDIYGDKVAFIHYKKGEKLIGIVIRHPQVAATMQAWFELAWLGVQALPPSHPQASDTPSTNP